MTGPTGPGRVMLVGAGPGAADLLTVRAARLIGEADTILHDALVEPEVLALARPGARIVCVGKRAGRPSMPQALINRLLVRAARGGGLVVRLKGGDPMLFGRAQEEIDALAGAGITVAIVPGVSAAFAAAAGAVTSLTRRGLARSVTFVTPATGRGEMAGSGWARAAASADTAALYMGRDDARAIRAALRDAGRPGTTPVLVVENAGRPGERQLRGTLDGLEQLAAATGDGPALVLVGQVFAALPAARDGPAPVRLAL